MAANERYAGNQQSGGYGVLSTISTPSTAPYLGYADGEHNWVGTAATSSGYWTQTGWFYNSYVSNATRYTEYNIPGGFCQSWWGTQNWNSSVTYKDTYESGFWTMYINGSYAVGVYSPSLPTPPTYLYALGEVHNSTTTVLNTLFYYIQWKNSSNSWNLFNQASWQHDSPYHVHSSSYHTFYASGPN